MLMGTPTAPVTLHNGAGFGGNIFLPWPTEACTLGTWSMKKLSERKADCMTQSLGKLEVFIISTSACSLKICLYVFVVWCNNSLIFVEMVQHNIKKFF